MQELLQQLESIELRIKELASLNQALKHHNEELTIENIQLKKDLDQLQGDRKALDQTLVEALQQVKRTKSDDQERRKMKKELGQYIKEIDKCIQLMQDIS